MSTQPVPALNSKAAVAVKVNSSKASVKETMSPPPSSESDKELLGSLTTVQQQRTSARVIKKLKLEPLPERDKRDNQECETPIKLDDKDPLKFPTVKQRMPKALWSADEKSLFFEALNEYGKDFDAITAHICAKMKKKGMPDGNLKTKTQVSHFYYRTWHKLSKHVRFDENVKKVAQELYALINYGELRKKLVSVNEKTCARLCEMVLGGSMVVRARGRNVRVRTPMCRALRRLNQITERGVGWRVCASVCVVLRARDAAAWARVQGAAHNPRLHVAAPLTAPLRTFLASLRKRWSWKHYNNIESSQGRSDEADDCQESRTSCDDHDCDDRLAIEPDRTIQDEKLHGRLSLHLGPRPSAEIHIPVVTPSEQLSSQKICFSSYLERVCEQRRDKDGSAKIRTPKRQRKDSANDKDKEDQKKFKLDDCETNKPMVIDETAIDGIELMANFKNNVEDEEKPSTEDEKELREEQTEDDIPTEPERDKYMSERDKYMSEREKDSFSEMEDEDKYKDDKTDSDNESDRDRGRDKDKFKNLKVKFRIRPKKRGGSIYTLVTDKETVMDSEEKFIDLKVNDTKPDDLKEDPSKEEDVNTALKQIRKGWSELDAGDLTIGDLYLMFGSRSKLELDYWFAEATPPLPQLHKSPPIDKDRHIDKGIERKERNDSLDDEKDRARESDNDMFSPKNVFGQDSNDGMSGDERKCEQLASPEHKSAGGSLKLTSKLINRPTPNPPSDNGFNVMTDRLKRLLALAGNPHVSVPQTTSSNVCNCGHVCPEQRDRQKELYPPELSKVDDTSSVFRHPIPIAPKISDSEDQTPELDLEGISKWRVGGRGKEMYSPTSSVFRQPTPIAPKPDHVAQKSELNLEGIPKWRRGRPRGSQRRVVVQRLLPLLPRLTTPQHNNSVPLKIVSGSQPALPKILPKPPPTSTSDLSYFYVLSESNGQFFFHDGDRRVPITPLPDNQDPQQSTDDDSKDEDYRDDAKEECDVKTDITIVEHEVGCVAGIPESKQSQVPPASEQKDDKQDIANFLPTESMSLSPSRLLRTSEGWLDSNVQDFSLSSFLGHLDTRVQPDLNVDSQLQSLMVESSVDYVAKFADLAAEVTDEPTLNTDHLT